MKNKIWCKHIKYYQEYVDGSKRYSWFMNNISDDVPKNWQFCPICKAKRPNK